jgi:hypothetical protein
MSATMHALPPPSVSPMLLADRMLALAEQADRAGLADTAGRLVALAHTVFDERRGGVE